MTMVLVRSMPHQLRRQGPDPLPQVRRKAHLLKGPRLHAAHQHCGLFPSGR